MPDNLFFYIQKESDQSPESLIAGMAVRADANSEQTMCGLEAKENTKTDKSSSHLGQL